LMHRTLTACPWDFSPGLQIEAQVQLSPRLTLVEPILELDFECKRVAKLLQVRDGSGVLNFRKGSSLPRTIPLSTLSRISHPLVFLRKPLTGAFWRFALRGVSKSDGGGPFALRFSRSVISPMMVNVFGYRVRLMMHLMQISLFKQ